MGTGSNSSGGGSLAKVTELGPSLLIAASCLLAHWVMTTSIADDWIGLPDTWVAQFWRTKRAPGYQRWVNTGIGAFFAAMATFVMIVFLFGGQHMTVIGAAELVLAGSYVWYLTKNRPGKDVPGAP